MSKPQWLKDRECRAQRITREPDLCFDCIYSGRFVRYAKYRNREKIEVRDCDIHPGCLNTKYSICCEDFTHE